MFVISRESRNSAIFSVLQGSFLKYTLRWGQMCPCDNKQTSKLCSSRPAKKQAALPHTILNSVHNSAVPSLHQPRGPDDWFGRLRCLLSTISTINSPADRTQTQCTLPNRYCTLICMYVHAASKTYSSSKQHVQLLYMVHCHCKLRSAKGK